MLKAQFSTLIIYTPFKKKRKTSNEKESLIDNKSDNESLSSGKTLKKSKEFSKKEKKKLETDFYRILVQLKYSIFADNCFPYVTNNNFFDWKDFFNRFQGYKKETLKRIIKSN